jgi:hypothetical protein
LLLHFGLGSVAALKKFKYNAGIFHNGFYLLVGICPNFFCFDGG